MTIHIMDGEIFKSAYIAPEIREIFDEKIPMKVAEEIKNKATLKHVKFERIVEINSKVKLASVATIRALAEICEKDAGEYIHYGSCSPELFENTLAYRIRKTMDIFERELHTIRSLLIHLADKHKHTLMVDRSHGQQGNPTTFGLVAGIWSDAIAKHIERFQEARKRILVGSLKGAFGNYASYYAIAGEKCLEMEKQVLKRLGLCPNRISIRRHIERYAEFLNLLSLLSITFEKICDDIFSQQRNEIGELEEPFDSENQIGSSTLPHKRNPVLSEAIIAWSKKIRSNASAFSETHMRDSHDIIGFYIEDLIIPETCILTGSMLNYAKYILENLKVKKDIMQKNLELSNGLIMAESLMLALSKKTKKKQTTHHILHKIAMEAFEKGIPFNQCILENKEICVHLTKEEIQNLLNPGNYLGMNDQCIEKVIRS